MALIFTPKLHSLFPNHTPHPSVAHTHSQKVGSGTKAEYGMTLDTVLQALWTSFIYLLRQAWNFVWNFCLADQPAPPQHWADHKRMLSPPQHWADHKYRITPHLLLHGL